MATVEQYRAYDPLAWFYNRYWGEQYHPWAMRILDELVISRLAPGAPVLDLCCGAGHLARTLAARGFRITGIDGSEEMIFYARQNVPAGVFIAADARAFTLPSRFEAVVSTFESLSHIIRLDELTKTFRNVHAALMDSGWFVFDLLREEGYRTNWDKSSAIIEDNNVCIIRGGYDPDSRIARTVVTMFRREENSGWHRSDSSLLQRCYAAEEIHAALRQAGFADISTHDAQQEFGMPGDLGAGRVFFRARKQ